ncbi:MAG: acyloxyacyl hydrolase [Bacteroidota bacterium]
MYIILNSTIFSQESEQNKSFTTDKYNIETDAGYGFILPHHPYFNYLMESHPYTIDIRFNKQLSGKYEWHKIFRYPMFGYGLHYADLGNKEYLGKAFAGYGTINIPIIQSRFISFNYSISAGFSYLTKYFDIEDGYYSLPIGSHGNVFFRLSSGVRYKLSKSTYLFNNISITHYSNGAWAMPNSGINVVTAHAGILYSFKPGNIYNVELNDHRKTNRYEVILSTGIKEISPPTGEKYFISTFSFNAKRQFWRKRNLGIGLDNFYDHSLITRLERDTAVINTFSGYQAGIHFSHDLCFGNTSITIQMGRYLYSQYKTNGMIYSRYGLEHKIKDRYIINLALKTHFFKADFIEWGFGYIISR